MSRHSKEIVISPKTLIYIVAGIAVLLIAVYAITSIVKNNKNNSASSTPSSTTSNVQSSQSSTDSSDTNTPNPKIYGVENGRIYYTTQYVYITDDNIKSVTVNGDDFDTEFFLEGNAENMYVIEATDQDGNVTTYIVYTKTIKSLTEAINSLNKYTVTADNLEDLLFIKDTITNTGTKYSPTEETAELDNALTSCENFITIITDVQQKIDALTADYENPEHLESVQNDIQHLASIITQIDELLATNNLTDSQRIQLTSMRGKYDNWLSKASALEVVQ